MLGLAGLLGLGSLVTVAGCASSPGVTPSGLPKLGRYASPAQLDWMLGRYEALAQDPGSSAELREEACLGWERAIFDLQSGRRYPMLLRMSTDTINLANLWQDLPLLARRHPRPSSCAEGISSADTTAPTVVPSAPTGPSVPALSTAEPMATPGEGGQGATSQGNSAAVGPIVAAPAKDPAASAQTPAGLSPSAPPPVVAASASSESLVARQRQQLKRLRLALGMTNEPSVRDGDAANPEAARLEPGPDRRPTPSPMLDDAAVQVLSELAESELPPISLRARFHLLGLCIRAVEAGDRYLYEPPASAGQPSATFLAGEKVCGLRSPKESLRRGQGRRLWSLLQAWRKKYPEPMGDIVIGLASFASRDNPLVDGPRVSR